MQPRKYWKLSGTVSRYRNYIIAATIFLALAFLITKYGRILAVTCLIDGQTPSTEVEMVCQSYKDSSIFLFGQKKFLVRLDKYGTYEVEKFKIDFSRKVSINLKEVYKPINIKMLYVTSFPELDIYNYLYSSNSAIIEKPSIQIQRWSSSQTLSSIMISNKGSLQSSSEGSKISVFLTQNQDASYFTQLYKIFTFISKNTKFDELMVLDDQIFLSRNGQPDIIFLVPSDLVKLKSALDSLDYLRDQKTNSIVIDLRFKNPVIR